MRGALPAALLAGAATVAGFSPFDLFPLGILGPAVLFALWARAPAPGRAALLGFAWGLGCFLAGVSWVYVSLHEVGGLAAPLAAASTLAFCALLAVFPALAGFAYGLGRSGSVMADALLAAAAWTLAEWLRGWAFTGFPWLAIGYAQTPPSPLAGYVPLLGVYGVGLLAALLAALAALAWRRPAAWLAAAAIVAGGAALGRLAWTVPSGEPLTVSLLQGNIPQSMKWVPERLPQSIETYVRLAAAHPAQLTVLPETALPLMFQRIAPDTLQGLTRHGTVLLGSAYRTGEGGYANVAVAVTPALDVQHYAKVHLVPFGEYVPPGFAWFLRLVDIPMGDFTAGSPAQRPLQVLGQRLMPNICYEDLFGEEIRRALPEATLLVNLSNTAWFGDSLAQPQHLQIARIRALETGRPILRATNTGMTAAVAPDGRVEAVLPAFTTAALTVVVQGRQGETPFVRYGNLPALLLALLACLPAWRIRRAGQRAMGGGR